MPELHRASTGWDTKGPQSKGHRAGRHVAPSPQRVLVQPIHAVEEGNTTALCGAEVPATDGAPWLRGFFKRCRECRDRASEL